MQKTLAATAIAALMSVAGAANAADIYSGGFKDGPVGYYPVWVGFYGGLFAGGAWGSLEVADENNNLEHFTNSTSAFFGGGQLGYLYQLGQVVVGPEVDLGEIGFSSRAVEPGLAPITASSIGSGFHFDITGRLGYAYGPGLFYFKGGYAQFQGRLSLTDSASVVNFSDRAGFTVGAGVEYQINPAWSVKAEYQYFDFSGPGSQFTLPTEGSPYDYTFTVQTVKVGFNYHLGGCCAPLK
jgi:outer membrane immunogenic protein